MPYVIKLTERYRGRDDFATVTVSLDDKSDLSDMRRLISQYGIKYPVIWQEDANRPGSDYRFDWDVNGVPSAFIIDPQGTIVEETDVSEGIHFLLDYLMAQPGPNLSYVLELRTETLADGSHDLAVHATSPGHLPLAVEVTVAKDIGKYIRWEDGKSVQIAEPPDGTYLFDTYRYTLDGFDDLVLEFTFSEFGEDTRHVIIPAVKADNLWRIVIQAHCLLPCALDYDGPYEPSLYASESIWADEQ